MLRKYARRVSLLILTMFLAAAPAGAAQVIDASGDILSIHLNSGKLVRLDSPASSVFVGNPEIADVQVQSPTIVYVFGKKTGRTNLFAINNKGKVLLNSPLAITHDISGLDAALNDLMPGGLIKAKSMPTGIMLTGRVVSPTESENARRVAELYLGGGQIFNLVSIEGATQINLRVRMAEVSRSVTKQFGINWEALSSVGNFTFGLTQGAAIGAAALGNRLGSANAAFGSYSSGPTDINGLIDALEEEDLINVLAEPNLTAMSGESASFLAGGEFPIPVPQEDGAISVEFKEYGISLEFTPTLVGENRINLKVKPEVSQLSSAQAINVNNVFIQALTTRRAETTVELGSGQSFAIAGLLNNDVDNNISKTPVLGDLPILGALFRSTSFQKNESELVIIVTPYMVEPVNSRIALPTDGYVPPNDKDTNLDGKMFRPTNAEPVSQGAPQTGATADSSVKLVGPAGFILE